MKKALLIASLLLIGSFTGCSFSESTPVYEIDTPSYEQTTQGLNTSSAATVANAAENGLFSIETTAQGQRLFKNNGNGYEVAIPDNVEVIDMGDATYRSTLASDTMRLEIFTQTLNNKDITADTYLGYSNKFLENTQEFTKRFDETIETETRTTHLLAWDRRALSGITNDRNHCAAIDVVEGDRVISLQLTAQAPLTKETLLTYADSLVFTKPSADAKDYPRFAQTRDNLNQETKDFYTATFAEDAPLSWGIFEPSTKANVPGKLPKLEKALDHQFNIVLYYSGLKQNYEKDSIYNTLNTIWQQGAVTELTLQPKLYDPIAEKNTVYDILDGKYDDFLHAYAKDVAQFGHPVLFRLFNEMNGDWCTYSALWAGRDCHTYVDVYRYVYQIFEEEGATANTLWVWNPNEKSFPNFAWNAVDNYYPGDDVVDIVGLTGYNTGDYYEGETWRSFDDIYTPIYQAMAPQYQQPLMITEFSCSDIGGDKAKWVKDMFEALPNYPRIKAAVWWNSADYDTDGTVARSYFIDSNDEAFAIFKEALAENNSN